MNQQISISLPTEVIEAINTRVDAGTYASASDVVLAAMRALADQDDDYDARIASIRARVKASIEDPRPALTGEQVKARLDAFFESRR